MKTVKDETKVTSEQKLYRFACELYFRTKGKSYVNGTQAMLGEYDEHGNRRTLAQLMSISKSYGITTFIELGLMETEDGKKYTTSSKVRWIGEAPTKEISATLKQWCKDYSKKMADLKSERDFEAALKAEQEALKAKETEAPVETPVETSVGTPVVTKAELKEMFTEEKATAEAPTVQPVAQSTDRQTVLTQFIQVQIERNEIEAQRNRILASILTEFKKLNEAKIILGNEYNARG